MKIIIVFMASVFLSACDLGEVSRPDNCLRADLFKQCLAAVPKGPERIGNSNDWDEVVGACENAAYHQSLRKLSSIKKECQP